jgi:hypothetical protein
MLDLALMLPTVELLPFPREQASLYTRAGDNYSSEKKSAIPQWSCVSLARLSIWWSANISVINTALHRRFSVFLDIIGSYIRTFIVRCLV